MIESKNNLKPETLPPVLEPHASGSPQGLCFGRSVGENNGKSQHRG